MQLGRSELRALTHWSPDYDPNWDDSPQLYVVNSIVGWGMSRRLGLLRTGRSKVYFGVQHIDPGKPGWGNFEEPQSRFFASIFLDGVCVALRTFPTMDQTLEAAASFLERTGDRA